MKGDGEMMAAAQADQSGDSQTPEPVGIHFVDQVEMHAQNDRNHLAAEGYRALSTDASAFAEASIPLAMNIWPVWCETGDAKSG